MRKITLDVKVRLVIRAKEGVSIDDILSKITYSFAGNGFDVESTEIVDHGVKIEKKRTGVFSFLMHKFDELDRKEKGQCINCGEPLLPGVTGPRCIPCQDVEDEIRREIEEEEEGE